MSSSESLPNQVSSVCTSAGKPFVCQVIVQDPEGSVEVTGLHELIHGCA